MPPYQWRLAGTLLAYNVFCQQTAVRGWYVSQIETDDKQISQHYAISDTYRHQLTVFLSKMPASNRQLTLLI